MRNPMHHDSVCQTRGHDCEEYDNLLDRCGELRARVAEVEALHRLYYNQPFAEACKRAAAEERERIIALLDEGFYIYYPGTEDDIDADALRAALEPKG